MRDDPIIGIRDLRVRYGALLAVDGLSLDIRRGEIFGLLGPNGAGKTTTLLCVEGLRRPDEGSIVVAGHDVARETSAVKRTLGVQLQRSALFGELTATELVQLYAAMYDVFPSRQEALALLERVGLGPKASARAEQLSGGQQQRLALALALVNDPEVVLLDEPTTGLDPQARRGVWALIERIRERGRTVLLTTHSMGEAQELCDRVAILDGGRLIALGPPEELVRRHAAARSPAAAAQRRPNLEDVFLALTGKGLADGGEARDELPGEVA
jgi:ABC-2 type transport system ATP-binding protein